jgi:hypothetical protein
MNTNVTAINGPSDLAVLADLVSRRWQEPRPYYAPAGSLEAAWRLKSSSAALEMYWSRRGSFVVSAGLAGT